MQKCQRIWRNEWTRLTWRMAHMNKLSNLKRVLKLYGLEARYELQKNTVSQYSTKSNSEKPKPTCHHCKKPENYKNQCMPLAEETKGTSGGHKKTVLGTTKATKVHPQTLIPTPRTTTTIVTKKNRKPRTVNTPCDTCGKTNHSTESCYFGANTAIRLPPWSQHSNQTASLKQENSRSKELKSKLG